MKKVLNFGAVNFLFGIYIKARSSSLNVLFLPFNRFLKILKNVKIGCADIKLSGN